MVVGLVNWAILFYKIVLFNSDITYRLVVSLILVNSHYLSHACICTAHLIKIYFSLQLMTSYLKYAWEIIYSSFLLFWIFQYYLLLSPLKFSALLASLHLSYWYLASTCPIYFGTSVPTVPSFFTVAGSQILIYLGQWYGPVGRSTSCHLSEDASEISRIHMVEREN